MSLNDLQLALPEIFVLAMACVVLLVDLFVRDDRRGLTHMLACLTLVFTGIIVLRVMMPAGDNAFVFGDTMIRDRFGDLLKLFALIVQFGVFIYAKHYLRTFDLFKGEFYTLSLFALLGAMILISASSLLTVYLGLELLSLSSYALVALDRNSRLGSESAMKYFVLGSLASGLLLYGMSLIYGATGSLDLIAVREGVVAVLPPDPMVIFGLVFIVVGIAFKFGVVPFHMWVPDVYHGAPLAITLFLGTVPKLAALALALRLLGYGMPGLAPDWQTMLMILAALSMVLGNVVAIAQTNIKRMLAYSTIGHMGFVFMGILAAGPTGYAAAMFYSVTYVMMAGGAFAVVILLSRGDREADQLDDFRGLARREPWYAFIMMMFMFSLAGVPVFVGFFAKWQVISAALSAGQVSLAILAVVASVIGAFYYLRVVKLMYFDEPETDARIQVPVDFRAMLSINGVAMIGLGVFSGPLIALCASAFV